MPCGYVIIQKTCPFRLFVKADLEAKTDYAYISLKKEHLHFFPKDALMFVSSNHVIHGLMSNIRTGKEFESSLIPPSRNNLELS